LPEERGVRSERPARPVLWETEVGGTRLGDPGGVWKRQPWGETVEEPPAERGRERIMFDLQGHRATPALPRFVCKKVP